MSNEEPVIIDDTPKENNIKETVEVLKEDVSKEKVQEVVIQDFPTSLEGTSNGVNVSLPSNSSAKIVECLNNIPNISVNDDPSTRKWGKVITESIYNGTSNDVLMDTVQNTDASFHQKITHNGKDFGLSAPTMSKVENENLKGERALFRIMSFLGMGSIFQVPLWHSGIWVSFKPPTESEIVELNRLIISDKITLGRNSYGLLYSNTTVYSVGKIIDFALSHVYDLTTKREDIDVGNLKEHISCQDIFSLLWGFVCTMYPKGFNFSRACINDPDKCNYVAEEVLNVSKLQWTNKNSLSDWQKTHMSSRQPRLKDLSSIKRYKEELLKSQPFTVEITADNGNIIKFTLKTPNITEYIDSGHRWIGSIVDTVNSAMGSSTDKNERDKFIMDKGKASSMRQYTHWVQSIEFETNITDDQETIEKLLDNLSASDSIRNDFLNKIVKYINDSTISVIGIPVFDCPKCGKEQTPHNHYPKAVDIIPIDVIQVFFELTAQRLGRIVDR